MSDQYGKIISLILQERFGDVVESVANYLFRYGPSTLFHLKKFTEIPVSKIKDSLAVLLKYNLVSTKSKHNTIMYTLLSNKVLLMLRYPKYVKTLKKKFGVEAGMVMEEILQKGYVKHTDLIDAVLLRLSTIGNGIHKNVLEEKIKSLEIANYLINYKIGEDIKVDEKKLTTKVYTVNFDRFHQDMRDELIVQAFENKFDSNAGELIRLFIQQMYVRTEPWAETSNPVPTLEVKDIVKKMNSFPLLLASFDHYITVLDQDTSKFMQKVGEASGGSYQLCMKGIFTVFAWEICEQIVLEKFDSKAARIFRLVKNKSYIEPEQIQKLAMIPAKEAKRLSYQLVEENFFQIQELKKVASASNTGPNKSFVLFHIQFNCLVRTIIEMCYKTLFNVMTRRTHFKFLNKRIIDKKQRIDTILLSMKAQGAAEEQLQDIEEMLTPPEREVLAKIEISLKKLNALEIEIDETLFYLELYLHYQ
nr:DNA-directed RNA polymerase III subunit RPC3 [Onthophagus taurus]